MTRSALFPAHGINPDAREPFKPLAPMLLGKHDVCIGSHGGAHVPDSLRCSLQKHRSSLPNIAGKGTDHVGQGRRHHGPATPMDRGLYSTIPCSRLQKHAAMFTSDER